MAAMANSAPKPWVTEFAISSPSVYSRMSRALFVALADVCDTSLRTACMLA